MKTKLLCLVGRHKWLRLATQPNGIGFLDQCEHCGRGRCLLWIGHASSAWKFSRSEMEKRLAESVPHAQDFLNAEIVIDHLLQNLAIECQLSMDGWDRNTMQKHVNKRGALLVAKSALLDEAERLLKLL